MATNKKKLLITQSMAPAGWALLKERGDIEAVEFPNTISAADFQALLAKQAPVNGVALGVTRFGQKELEASREMLVVARIGVGYDAVDVPALTAKKIPLMVAGTANSPSVAEQAMFMMLMLAKRGAELHAMVAGQQVERAPERRAGRPLRQDRADRRLRPHRHAQRQALPGHGDERAGLRPLQAGRRDQGRRLRAGHGPRCGPAARRLRHHPLPQDARDGRHVQRRAAGAHEAHGLPGQHRARRHHRRAGAARGADRRASSPAPASTCSRRSRRPPTTRC